MVLWLDDLRPAPEHFIHVHNYKEFVEWINKNGLPDTIYFDHDLGEELTGYDCAKWVVNYCLDKNINIPKYYIQSMNPVGKENIIGVLENYRKYYEQTELR